jgi:uncharacterized oligopeptide transporter (OPT) family protein
MVTLLDIVKNDVKQFYTHLSEATPYIAHGLYTPLLMKRGLTKLAELNVDNNNNNNNNSLSYQGLGYLAGTAFAGTVLLGATMKYGLVVPMIAVATNATDYLINANKRVQKQNDELSNLIIPEEIDIFAQN